jgi:hypothetical protein
MAVYADQGLAFWNYPGPGISAGKISGRISSLPGFKLRAAGLAFGLSGVLIGGWGAVISKRCHHFHDNYLTFKDN